MELIDCISSLSVGCGELDRMIQSNYYWCNDAVLAAQSPLNQRICGTVTSIIAK
jgi:hypothetical protein